MSLIKPGRLDHLTIAKGFSCSHSTILRLAREYAPSNQNLSNLNKEMINTSTGPYSPIAFRLGMIHDFGKSGLSSECSHGDSKRSIEPFLHHQPREASAASLPKQSEEIAKTRRNLGTYRSSSFSASMFYSRRSRTPQMEVCCELMIIRYQDKLRGQCRQLLHHTEDHEHQSSF